MAGNIAGRVSNLAAIMLKHRLTPPPKEAYTLHRKLSGAFLTCKKLEAKISCRTAFMDIYNKYQWGVDAHEDSKKIPLIDEAVPNEFASSSPIRETK